MKNKKSKKPSETPDELNDSPTTYGESGSLLIFNSFEDQEKCNRLQMARLSPLERMQHLRKMINIAYGMHGYDPNNLPSKHQIRIL